LELLDAIESPVLPHSDAAAYPPGELARLLSNGILGSPVQADRIPRPRRFGPGPDVDVHEGPVGPVGVVEDDDYHYEPIPLTDEDTWGYSISHPHLVEEIRKANSIDAKHFSYDNGLIRVGEKSVDGVGIVDVHLSVANSSRDSVLARCRRLTAISSHRPVVLLTPGPINLSREDLGILAFGHIVVVSLTTAAGEGHLRVNWEEAVAPATRAGGAPASVGPAEPDLERLIEGKPSVRIATAARYLQRSSGHVERLVRDGTLKRVGQGRPTQVSTASLRERKGTQEGPDL
jgi:hypothetical protein